MRITTHNTRLAQWGLTSLIGGLCFYCKFVLADSLVFQNPPLRQAWERWQQAYYDTTKQTLTRKEK
jgi:hypothetical protein